MSFSIPESKIVDTVPPKTKTFAHIVPGDLSTYIFREEDAYRQDYQTAVFGKTWKKGGWDCLRHYEILANGCIPHFDRLNECPTNTMTHFPKEIVAKAMVSETPKDYIPELLEYTRKHLTCRAMAQYVLTTIGCPSPKRVLFLSQAPHPDYLRCLTLIGFKQILGANCVDAIHVPHIYEDYESPERLYGRGFSYTQIVPVSSKSPHLDIEDIRSHSFDIVVYGSTHRGLPHWDLVHSVYSPSEIVLLCGEDVEPSNTPHILGERGYNVFIREL
jgi:hypothetical protein